MFVTFRNFGRMGRLGNQLFQIAATIGVARRHGCEFAFPPWRYSATFEKPLPQKAELPSTQPYVEQAFCFQEIIIKESTHLLGYFQSEKYFKHCETEVRAFLTPSAGVADRLRTRFAPFRGKKACSIHLRRGDYVGNPHFVDLSGTDYYERAMARVDSGTIFLCFSDDIPWCRNYFHDDRVVFIDGLRPVEDLLLMSQCNTHIIANSSFSWWGAWLNGRQDKTVISPARWFAGEHADPEMPFGILPRPHGYLDTKDLLPVEWIRL